ncbi:MAG TPA: GNAT family N-acetyltransferase [Candidatus Baltobacteraceae bacterium]|nr:GNAT family N-acetyltransferase [Candidatus Baltobacteraceae bacterium]
MDLQNSSSEVRSAIECRAAGADEYPAAAQLRADMALEMGSDFDGAAADWRTKFAAYFGGKQAVGGAQLFLAYDGEAPIGCAIISILDHYRRYVFGTEVGFINAVYVHPDYRRRGVANRLMRLAIAWARERGCRSVRLRSSDEGRFLYEQLGFREGREMELDLGAADAGSTHRSVPGH